MTGQKIRLFLVEDSPVIATYLAGLLARDGRCEVVGRADTEQTALEWSFQNEAGFDVAVVDLMLREGSGFGVLAHLHKYQPGKIVVLSEFATPVIAERCKALGAVAAFQKSKMADCVAYIHSLAAPADR